MVKYRCYIVDDEPLALDVIEQHLSKFDQFEICGKTTDSLKAYSEIKLVGRLIDPQGLSRFYFYSLNLDLNVVIDFPDNTFEHILKETFLIAEGSQPGVHGTTVILVNKRGLNIYILDLSIEVLEMESGN